ncbi:MAG: hypothetical protein H0U00_09570 [Actinobacteria bacterium]|nr:hypothetical protein [Actinomycetota bacterium]
MKGLIVTIAAALALGAVLAVPVATGASGGGQPTFHFHEDVAGIDPDVCGTGKSVAFDGRVNGIREDWWSCRPRRGDARCLRV